jgi:hypothetical protein
MSGAGRRPRFIIPVLRFAHARGSPIGSHWLAVLGALLRRLLVGTTAFAVLPADCLRLRSSLPIFVLSPPLGTNGN